MSDGILENIYAKMETIADVQRGIPRQIELLKGDMANTAELAALSAIERHAKDCSVRQDFGKIADRTAENTGAIDVMRESGWVKRSVAPAMRRARRIPLAIRIILAILSTSGFTALVTSYLS